MKNNMLKKTKNIALYQWALIFFLGVLFIHLLLFFTLDVRGLFGYTDSLVRQDYLIPFFWYHFFADAQTVEIPQWIALSFCVLTCGFIAGKESEKKRFANSRFFILIGLGLCIMVLEDAGNFRHVISHYASLFFNQHGLRSPIKTLTELSIYFTLGLLMVFPILRYLKGLNLNKKALSLLFGGYTSYFLASAMSATRNIFTWYDKAGEFLINNLPLSTPVIWERTASSLENHAGYFPLGYYFMDFLIEESLELIGASLLLGFLLYYARNLKTT